MIRLDSGAMRIGAAALSLSLLTAVVPAQAASAAPAQAAAPSQPAQEITPDRLALARKYIDLTDKVDIFGTTVTQTAAQTLNQILKLNPGLTKQATEAVTDVVKQYKGQRGQLMDQVARIYAQNFTADELQQYVNFYSSPAGQKLASTNFTINQELQRVMELFSMNLKTEFYEKVRADLKTKGVTL
jgi:hypothetical protein